MRWSSAFPQIGETRIIKRFLLLPTMINGETRWLERAIIKQIWHSGNSGNGWDNIGWANA